MFNFEMDFNRLLAGVLNLLLGRVTLGLSRREEGRSRVATTALGLSLLVMGALYVFTSARTWFGDAAEDEEEEF